MGLSDPMENFSWIEVELFGVSRNWIGERLTKGILTVRPLVGNIHSDM